MSRKTPLSELAASLVNMVWFTVLLFPFLVMKVGVTSGKATIVFR
jgi:hypothetical protein